MSNEFWDYCPVSEYIKKMASEQEPVECPICFSSMDEDKCDNKECESNDE